MDIAVLFADVRGSTGLGELLPPSAFAALMNNFYQVATKVLVAHDAIIDKLVGDEVMALFVPGFCGSSYRLSAAEAGEALVRAVGYGGSGKPWLPLGVGVHTGPAYVGNVGSGSITDFTALGDTINTAARLQAEASGGEVVLSEAVYETAAERYPDLEQRLLTLPGRGDPITVRVLRPSSR